VEEGQKLGGADVGETGTEHSTWLTTITTVDGFHGTTGAKAETIVREGFDQSENDFDWLGSGVYFYQDGPYRAEKWALEWAVKRYGGEAAVVGATIMLERSTLMDLIDMLWSERLRTFYKEYRDYCVRFGKPIPEQQAHPEVPRAHRLDCDVVNKFVHYYSTKKATPISAVRAAFEEGKLV
jgi:hypothetical protein